ncbi:hypothetical protein, partial [Enterobacter hormaechei]
GFDHALDEPGGGDGLHTVFPLKMPGGRGVFPPAVLCLPAHPQHHRAIFFIKNPKKKFFKIPINLKKYN